MVNGNGGLLGIFHNLAKANLDPSPLTPPTESMRRSADRKADFLGAQRGSYRALVG